jgi:hypothetical protein
VRGRLPSAHSSVRVGTSTPPSLFSSQATPPPSALWDNNTSFSLLRLCIPFTIMSAPPIDEPLTRKVVSSTYHEYKKDTEDLAGWLSWTSQQCGYTLTLEPKAPLPKAPRLKGKARKAAKFNTPKVQPGEHPQCAIEVAQFVEMAHAIEISNRNSKSRQRCKQSSTGSYCPERTSPGGSKVDTTITEATGDTPISLASWTKPATFCGPWCLGKLLCQNTSRYRTYLLDSWLKKPICSTISSSR